MASFLPRRKIDNLQRKLHYVVIHWLYVHCTYIVVHFIQVFFCYHKMHILHTQMVSISLQTLSSIAAEKNSTIIFPIPIDFVSQFIKTRTSPPVSPNKAK